MLRSGTSTGTAETTRAPTKPKGLAATAFLFSGRAGSHWYHIGPRSKLLPDSPAWGLVAQDWMPLCSTSARAPEASRNGFPIIRASWEPLVPYRA